MTGLSGPGPAAQGDDPATGLPPAAGPAGGSPAADQPPPPSAADPARTADPPPPPEADPARAADLRDRLAAVQARIAAACAAAGRSRSDVTLIAVTKTWPAPDVIALLGAGPDAPRDLGEARDQEAGPKVRELAAAGVTGLRWHFIGRLQTNKARSVAAYADVVHSVDRPALVTALGAGARRVGRELAVLLQVSLDGDPGRGGALPGDVPPLADAVAAEPGLRLAGVMAVAPLGADPADAFARLAATAERVRGDHPTATWLSAGMSGDLEQAVAAGATHLRVGSALFGGRPPPGR